MIPPIADRFVAGETPDEALDYVSDLRSDGIHGILNLLGEHYKERSPADMDTASYIELIEKINRRGLNASISVKPSQIGLQVGREVFRENLELVLEEAYASGVTVWLDMEDSSTTDATLAVYRDFVVNHDLGVCLQSNLKRTPGDLDGISGTPGRVRLVKGAYDEPREIAYIDREKVNEMYRSNLRRALQPDFRPEVALGTHDLGMIEYADGVGGDFEVQMLMGVREELQRRLARERRVAQYVPFGGKWISYFYRRVRERKENFLFAVRAVMGG